MVICAVRVQGQKSLDWLREDIIFAQDEDKITAVRVDTRRAPFTVRTSPRRVL